ncbi:MAG: redox-sensing transcriptional repressor Rex [Mucinivorans sp.]
MSQSGAPKNLLPERTVERLSEYRRTLLSVLECGHSHIYSHELAGMHAITAVQVRRDLMLIGFSSDTKRGYDVSVLVDFISTILDKPQGQKVVVVGMGNLGQAITHYFNGKRSRLHIVEAYDIDKQKVGKEIAGVMCCDITDFTARAHQLKIDIVLLSCPQEVALEIASVIKKSSVSGVLNFTGVPLNLGDRIFVEDYDIITLLEKVAYFAKNSAQQ